MLEYKDMHFLHRRVMSWNPVSVCGIVSWFRGRGAALFTLTICVHLRSQLHFAGLSTPPALPFQVGQLGTVGPVFSLCWVPAVLPDEQEEIRALRTQRRVSNRAWAYIVLSCWYGRQLILSPVYIVPLLLVWTPVVTVSSLHSSLLLVWTPVVTISSFPGPLTESLPNSIFFRILKMPLYALFSLPSPASLSLPHVGKSLCWYSLKLIWCLHRLPSLCSVIGFVSLHPSPTVVLTPVLGKGIILS